MDAISKISTIALPMSSILFLSIATSLNPTRNFLGTEAGSNILSEQLRHHHTDEKARV
jgi:hypothetical protein